MDGGGPSSPQRPKNARNLLRGVEAQLFDRQQEGSWEARLKNAEKEFSKENLARKTHEHLCEQHFERSNTDTQETKNRWAWARTNFGRKNGVLCGAKS